MKYCGSFAGACALVVAAFATVACSSDKSTPHVTPHEPNEDGGATPDEGVITDGGSTLEQRMACTFGAGTKAIDSLGLSAATRANIPIEHVIVAMKENRSFDHLFGMLGEAQPGSEPIPDDFSNEDAQGNDVKPFHLDTTCEATDPGHQWDEMHAQVNGGKMDGFVTSAASSMQTNPLPTDGHFVMGYYEESDLPFYYFLAKTYALADRHFPSVRSGTWANRDYLYCGTSDGVKNTLTDGIPGTSVQTIFDKMDAQQVTWGVYADDAPLSFSLEWGLDHRGVHPVQDLLDGLASGDLPSVIFVDGRLNQTDDHPPADVQAGEAWLKNIYDAAVVSPLWQKTALLFTFDEGGGFFDHVPPPEKTCIARPNNSKDADFFELGVRVPLIAISPWARRHTVSHVQHQHTSITRFIELVFDLPAMTTRDANSDALLDLFDFTQDATKTLPPAPSPGTGGCTK
ncbi:MAG TPA: alkaline phosphatase family protein [Polyangiaceae bacterium]|jgi:phospholipase C|nr:alkaline phosphatase family protein [Polyangiaceae bacterium]